MGEVYLARVSGASGFEKQVAVKRISPVMALSDMHRKMFIREAKLVARLTHPNIAQVLELGESGQELFIVMEFVPGIDLGGLLSALAKRNERLSTPVAALIAFDVLNALDYAHSQNEGGKSLDIVHRDISPQNVLISC